MNTVNPLQAWLAPKIKSHYIPIEDVERFCSYFIIDDSSYIFTSVGWLLKLSEVKFTESEIERFCHEFLAAKALNTFAYYVAIGNKKPCESCGTEMNEFEFDSYYAKPHYRPQTECEDCRFEGYRREYDSYDDDWSR